MRHFEDVQQAPLDDGKTPHLCQRPWASQRRNHTIRAPGLSVAGEAGMKGLPAAVLFWIGALGTFRGVEVRGQGLPDGSACSLDSDCASFRCDVGQCAEPNCQDLVRNGFETGVDCGGPCDGCLTRSFCYSGHDCRSGICWGDGASRQCAPARCDDSVANADETDADCGGNCFGACPDGFSCSLGFECISTRCLSNDKLSNNRICAPRRLYDVAGFSEYSSIVRGGFDIVGQAKSILDTSHLKRAVGTLLDLDSVHIATDSLQDVPGPRNYGEREPTVILPVDSLGRSISRSIDTVAAARFRFDLYVKPFEVDLYRERVDHIANVFVDISHAGDVVRRGVYGIVTLHQPGDEDGFSQPARRQLVEHAQLKSRSWGPAPPHSSISNHRRDLQDVPASNVTVPQGRALPDGTGVRLYLQDILMREGVNNTSVQQVDTAVEEGAPASSLYEPHHLVVQLHPNRTAEEPIIEGVDFPVQPVVYVADRHNRRIRLYDQTAYISVRLDQVLWPDGSMNAEGDTVELFGERSVELTYINDGRAYFRGLSVSAPVPEGLLVEFFFESDDPAMASIPVIPARSASFEVQAIYRPPKVEVERIPFPPAAVVAILIIVVGLMFVLSKHGLDCYRQRKQERHVVPAKEPASLASKKLAGLAFADDDEGMKAHVDELARGYVDSSGKAVAERDADPGEAKAAFGSAGLPRTQSAVVRGAQRIGAGLIPDQIASSTQAVSKLGNEDQARAFEMLQAGFGKPIPVSALPQHMQVLHRAGQLDMKNVMTDEEAEQQLDFEARKRREALRKAASSNTLRKKSWRPSMFAGMNKLASQEIRQAEPEAAAAQKTADGLVDVDVVSAPKPRSAQDYMKRAPARTPAETVHLASRVARRKASYAMAAVGMHETASRIFPVEESTAYLKGVSTEEAIKVQASSASRSLEPPPPAGAGAEEPMQTKPTVHSAFNRSSRVSFTRG